MTTDHYSDHSDVERLTTDDALAVDGDCDRMTGHVRHADAQQLTVVVQVPDANVLITASCNHL